MIKFGQIKEATKDDVAFSELRFLVTEFVKAIHHPKGVKSVIYDFTKEMSSRKITEASTAFNLSVGNIYPFDVFFTLKTENITRIIKNDFIKSDLMKDVFTSLGIASKDGRAGIVVFKMKHMGVFVCHNISLWKSPTPRILIPASKHGVDELNIQSIKHFEQDFNKLG